VKRPIAIVALCLVLVFLVACETQQESAKPSTASEATPLGSVDAEAKVLETSVAEVDDLDKELSAQYLDTLDEDLSSIDKIEWS